MIIQAELRRKQSEYEGEACSVDSITDAGFHCNVCIVEDGASLLIYVLYAG